LREFYVELGLYRSLGDNKPRPRQKPQWRLELQRIYGDLFAAIYRNDLLFLDLTPPPSNRKSVSVDCSAGMSAYFTHSLLTIKRMSIDYPPTSPVLSPSVQSIMWIQGVVVDQSLADSPGFRRGHITWFLSVSHTSEEAVHPADHSTHTISVLDLGSRLLKIYHYIWTSDCADEPLSPS